MCLMLYIGTNGDLPLVKSPDLSVEPVDDARRAVKEWFSRPVVSFIGAHTGCSCGFPSVIAELPIEYYAGMTLHSDNRAADLRSVRALLDLLARVSTSSDSGVELYPIADGEEAMRPKGVITWQLDSLDAERFFLNERFMHVVHGQPAART